MEVKTEKLFAKEVSVTVIDGYSDVYRSLKLFLTIEWQDFAAALQNKILQATLTDKNDPYFLYNLQLSEQDFLVLKKSLDLSVDFLSYPQYFIKYIEYTKENPSQYVSVLKFDEKIGNVSSSALLDVIETKDVRRVSVLPLKFFAATENETKKYLSSCYRNIKEENEILQSRLHTLERDFKEKLSAYQERLERKSQELENVRKELSVQLNMNECKHAQELLVERDKYMMKHKEEENRLEKDLRKKEQDYRKKVQELEARITFLDSQNRDSQDKNRKHEEKLRELRSRILSLEEELSRLKESFQLSKEQNDKLQSESKAKDLKINYQKEHIEKLEDELSGVKQNNRKMREQLEEYPKKLEKLEEEIWETKDLLKKEKRVSLQLEQDIAKANDVIQKFQNEVHHGHDKFKRGQKIITKQEKDLREKDVVIQGLTKDLTDARNEFKKTHNEKIILRDSLRALKERNADLEKNLKDQTNVINFLHRQLTDHSIAVQAVPPDAVPLKLKSTSAPDNSSNTVNGITKSRMPIVH